MTGPLRYSPASIWRRGAPQFAPITIESKILDALSRRLEKMKLAKDKKSLFVNDSLTLDGISPEVFDYRLGNRSALDWVIDQYQVSTDKRSAITSDPNREEDPQYIVRLVGQVIRVSVETVKIVNALPKSCGGRSPQVKRKPNLFKICAYLRHLRI